MEIKVYLVDSVLGIPFPETEAFPFSRVHVPAAAASVENDRARKVQKDMSEAIVKRIALKRIENRRREFNCWIRVGRWPPLSEYLQRKRGVGRRGILVLPGPVARDHRNSLGGNDWKALIATSGEKEMMV